MKVRVRLFAALRERAGSRELEVDLPEGARVGDVWSSLRLGDEPPGLLFALNHDYAAPDTALSPGDEVALIPPVSGGEAGAQPTSAFRLSPEPLSVGAAVDEVRRDGAGAIATFLGTARDRSRDRTVLYLEYEAYEGMAERMMVELAARLEERHDLCAIAIHHRVGRVDVGEASVVVAVSAPHRADALAACREAIDELKTTVPLWKKEVYEGGEEWIGRGS
jgi:molybdopterin synthase catalytic subunit/molybdopterin converting factor small subunit